jgi:hypothetical protein
MLEKTQTREEMEQSPSVYSFIKSNLLLDPDFHRVFMDIQKMSKEIEGMIVQFKEEIPSSERGYRAIFSKIDSEHLFRRLLYHGRAAKFQFRNKKEEETYKKTLLELKTNTYKSLITQIKRRSSNIQNMLSKFEQAKTKSVEILTFSTLFICKRCHNIVSKNRFINTICTCCGAKISHISDIRKEPIAFFDSRLQDFIDNNYWFEHGVDYLLRRKNFQTLCGVHVLGHSGCMHEIDNIAESKTSNFRIFGECKTAEIKTNDIFVFAGKMADIGCSRAYIFTITKDVQKEIVHLARSRNIAIVTGILNRPIQDLIKEIRED